MSRFTTTAPTRASSARSHRAATHPVRPELVEGLAGASTGSARTGDIPARTGSVLSCRDLSKRFREGPLDDELGALAAVHERIYKAGVNVYASNAVADGFGKYGYLIYVRPEDHERAAKALEV